MPHLPHFDVLQNLKRHTQTQLLKEAHLPVMTRRDVNTAWNSSPLGIYTRDFLLTSPNEIVEFVSQVASCVTQRQCPYVTIALDGNLIRVNVGDSSRVITGIEQDVANDISTIFQDIKYMNIDGEDLHDY
jgi:hypothetical protein